MERYVVVGRIDEPESWKIVDYGAKEEEFLFAAETKRGCRKWILVEIETRKKKLGKLMEKWLQDESKRRIE